MASTGFIWGTKVLKSWKNPKMALDGFYWLHMGDKDTKILKKSKMALDGFFWLYMGYKGAKILEKSENGPRWLLLASYGGQRY